MFTNRLLKKRKVYSTSKSFLIALEKEDSPTEMQTIQRVLLAIQDKSEKTSFRIG